MATTATTKKATPKKTNDVDEKVIQDLQAENQELNAKIDKLMAMMDGATATPASTPSPKMNLEDDVTVISLLPHTLNLCTEKNGGGNIYTFTKMYEEQDIPWGDLKDIMRHRNNREMAQNGKFYIASNEAVGLLRLRSTYKKLLTPDQFKSMTNQNFEQVVEFYKLASDGQKSIIVEVLKNKKLNHVEIDMNILHEMSDLTGIDFVNMINPEDIPVDGE